MACDSACKGPRGKTVSGPIWGEMGIVMRVSFKLAVRPGFEEDYRRRHEAVYPDLLQAFRELGVKTYSIFMDGTTLFAYMEVEDFDTAMRALERHPANIRWQAFMADILIAGEDGRTMEILPEVFHFEG